jgi:hypothetical protein
MYRDRDLDLKATLPSNQAGLIQDLDLETLFSAMSNRDMYIFDLAKRAVMDSLYEQDAIRYRQQILADCLNQPNMAREMYAIAVESLEREKKVWGGIAGRYPEGLLHRSVEVLRIFLGQLRKLRLIAEKKAHTCRSEGLMTFFAMVVEELDDDYLGSIEDHLRQLAFRYGLRMNGRLGKGNKGTHYVLSRSRVAKRTWMERLRVWCKRLLARERSGYVYQIADRDEGGFRALTELRDRGVSLVASALAQSTDHILSFFGMLRLELGFYIGCLNLRDQLARKGASTCFPEPSSSAFSGTGLYDVCLRLRNEGVVITNDLQADDKLLVMITGANRGGKSTFLRAIGLAQLMMQCGMFVPAEAMHIKICDGVFTHFKREEDAAMQSGKLDEELARMDEIIGHLNPNSVLLCNESFASTNEREGSEIAGHIVRALLDTGIRVYYVTHLFSLAQGLFQEQRDHALFLRADRLGDGRRTFRIVEGAPLPTSYGEDLYRRIFAGAPPIPAAPRAI